jgi:rhodanese-related sulfurtransferase
MSIEKALPQSISVSELQARLQAAGPPMVLDVRRSEAFEQSSLVIPGAVRCVPEFFDSWVKELPDGTPLVAYCVHGRQVSQGIASKLVESGFDAYYLVGGIEQWQQDGGATVEYEP